MRLYGDAIKALRQVILLDERVRNISLDLARIGQEVADLRDRVSRLEGILAAMMARPPQGDDGTRPTMVAETTRSSELPGGGCGHKTTHRKPPQSRATKGLVANLLRGAVLGPCDLFFSCINRRNGGDGATIQTGKE